MNRSAPGIALVFWLFVGLLVAGCAGSRNPASPESLHGLNNANHHAVHAQDLDRTFHVWVRVPEQADGTARYPVVYVLDGGLAFPMLAAYYRHLQLVETVPQTIIVGIGYPGARFADGNLRATDYTAPSKERDFWGGAHAFRDFLAGTVIPLVESRYPADPGHRILFGHSLGGQFVIDTALHQPELFRGLIASNPALHRNLDYFLEPVPAAHRARPKLYIGRAQFDAERFQVPLRQWLAHWEGRSKPFILKQEVLPGHNHMSSVPAAFQQGLVWHLLSPD